MMSSPLSSFLGLDFTSSLHESPGNVKTVSEIRRKPVFKDFCLFVYI